MMTINFKGDLMKLQLKLRFFCAFIGFSAASIALAEIKIEGEPIKAPGEVSLLGGFEGCVVAPPKDGCDARIKCAGVGMIYGNSAFSIRNATKEAQTKARGELVKFYSTKAYAKDEVRNAVDSMAQSNASGGDDMRELSKRAMGDIAGTSAEGVISGFQILGRQIDMEQRTVTVKGGVSCKSQNAAAKSQAASARSSSPSGSGAKQSGVSQSSEPGPAAVSTGPIKIDRVDQRIKGSDDF